MVGLLSSLLNPQPQNMAPQPSQPMAGQTQQPRGLLGLGGNLGGIMDFNDPQKLIAMQLIANGQKAPGQMFDGVPELAAYGAKMQQTKAQEEQERAARNQTAEFLKANDPALASLVESGALTPAQAYTEWAQKNDPANKLDLQYKQAQLDKLTNPGPDEFAQRAAVASQYGISETSPEYRAWVLEGKLPEAGKPMSAIGKLQADHAAGLIDDVQYQQAMANMAPKGMTIESDGAGGIRFTQGAPALTATDKKAMWAAEDELPLYDNTIASLEQAKALNDKTFSGTGAGMLGTIGTNVPGAGYIIDRDKAVATSEFNKLMSMEAIQAMAQTLKGATTDAELERFVSILADPSTDPAIRGRTIDRMLTLAQRQKEIKVNRINELRGVPSGSGMAPAVSSDALSRARKAIEMGADPNAVRQRLIDNGIDPAGL